MRTRRLILGILLVALIVLFMPTIQSRTTRTSVLIVPEGQELVTQMTIDSDDFVNVVVIDLASILEKYASEAKEKGRVELEDGTTITAQKIADSETKELVWRIEVRVQGMGECGLITVIQKDD